MKGLARPDFRAQCVGDVLVEQLDSIDELNLDVAVAGCALPRRSLLSLRLWHAVVPPRVREERGRACPSGSAAEPNAVARGGLKGAATYPVARDVILALKHIRGPGVPGLPLR